MTKMHKPPSTMTTANHQDDDDPDLNNSTSTNAALLPSGGSGGANSRNNGYLWKNNNNNNNDHHGRRTETDNNDHGEPSAAPSLVLMELGGTSPRVEVRGGGGQSNATGHSRHGTGGSGSRKGTTSTSKPDICCPNWREYRCQMIMLVAFIEFGILIAFVTFYFAATCDSNSAAGRQGKANVL